MADFQAHLTQAKKNLATLSKINLYINDSWDWQVTCAYYTAVHLMNAHLAQTVDQHYKTHVDVKNAIFNDGWPCRVTDDVYYSYSVLENYSRRARYLCHDKIELTDSTIAYKTFDKHLKKALSNLDVILKYFSDKYQIDFDTSLIDCIEIRNMNLKYFKYKKIGVAESA